MGFNSGLKGLKEVGKKEAVNLSGSYYYIL
jgi:hypothetical protein